MNVLSATDFIVSNQTWSLRVFSQTCMNSGFKANPSVGNPTMKRRLSRSGHGKCFVSVDLPASQIHSDIHVSLQQCKVQQTNNRVLVRSSNSQTCFLSSFIHHTRVWEGCSTNAFLDKFPQSVCPIKCGSSRYEAFCLQVFWITQAGLFPYAEPLILLGKFCETDIPSLFTLPQLNQHGRYLHCWSLSWTPPGLKQASRFLCLTL